MLVDDRPGIFSHHLPYIKRPHDMDDEEIERLVRKCEKKLWEFSKVLGIWVVVMTFSLKTIIVLAVVALVLFAAYRIATDNPGDEDTDDNEGRGDHDLVQWTSI